jgi:hypothetical protein
MEYVWWFLFSHYKHNDIFDCPWCRLISCNSFDKLYLCGYFVDRPMVASALWLGKSGIKFNSVELLLWIEWILKQSLSHKPWFHFRLPRNLPFGYSNIPSVGSFSKTIFKNWKSENLYRQASFHELHIEAILFLIPTLASLRFY